MMKQAPALPTWFLMHFGCSADNDALIGDLVERYQQPDKTAAWYWKQTLAAVIESAFNELRSRKLLTFRGLFVGWLVFSYVLLPPTGFLMKALLDRYRSFELDTWNTTAVAVWGYTLQAFMISLAFIIGFLSGWIVARLHDRRRVPIFLLTIVIPLSFVSGNFRGIHEPFFWIGVFTLAVGILSGGVFWVEPRHHPLIHPSRFPAR